MNPANQGNISDAVPSLPVKRKRGRPRKDKNLYQMETAPLPPGFEGVRKIQTPQVESFNESKDPAIGQAITGVVEAAFDAGYLLSVRIGNSNTNLRGVVFKPGHYVPVTAENDVAPNVKMIKRNEIQLPKESHTQAQDTKNHSSVLEGNYASSVVDSDLPVEADSKLIPVAVHSVNPSNGLSPVKQIPSSGAEETPMVASIGGDMQTVESLAALLPLDGFSFEKPGEPSLQLQTTHPVMQEGVQNENGDGKPAVQEGEHTMPTSLNGIVPSKVVPYVSESFDAENMNTACKSSPGEIAVSWGKEITDTKEPVSVEPPQSRLPDLHNKSDTIPSSLDSKSGGRMTELLQALQGNMMDNLGGP